MRPSDLKKCAALVQNKTERADYKTETISRKVTIEKQQKEKRDDGFTTEKQTLQKSIRKSYDFHHRCSRPKYHMIHIISRIMLFTLSLTL